MNQYLQLHPYLLININHIESIEKITLTDSYRIRIQTITGADYHKDYLTEKDRDQALQKLTNWVNCKFNLITI